MFNITKKEILWGGEKLTLETGKIARQSDGAVIASMGETVVMACAVAAKKVNENCDFFPLTIHYREMAFAAGKFPGGFFKREGRPSEKEILTSRLIDRPIRPMFPDNFRNETQVICTLLSHDMKNQPDIVALIAASAALSISGIPMLEPVAAVRVGLIDDEFILNPKFGEDMDKTSLDLVIAGTRSSILMVESEASEINEETMLKALEFGHKNIQPVIDLIKDFTESCGKERWAVNEDDRSKIYQALYDKISKDIKSAYAISSKQERVNKISQIYDSIIPEMVEAHLVGENIVKEELKILEKNIVRQEIMLKDKKRIDGRAFDEIRQIEAEVSFLPRLHGTALFTRGETQALAATTLGTGDDMQIVDSLEGETKERFLLHYNFPPYSVGEVSQLKPPGRRDIGHGKLAWRALNYILPEFKDFPYSIRVVSEITESNGSSSMATVCAGCLSMMDAGVPLKAHIAGIAMGLILEGDNHIILSDIMGDEDHLGDMDFKVAGTESGITALQMDIKVNGITFEIMKEALHQAKVGRIKILDIMKTALQGSRDTLSVYAPTITAIKISKDKIKDLIGTGGKVIKSICEKSGAKIEIEDDGTVKIATINAEQKAIATQMIQDVVCDPEIGEIYEGKVSRIVDFGAFVTFLGKKEGLVHISELADSHVGSVEDVVKEGDIIKVKVLGVDQRGKIKLSVKAVNSSDDKQKTESKKDKNSENQPVEDNNTHEVDGNSNHKENKKPKKSFDKPKGNKSESNKFVKRKYYN